MELRETTALLDGILREQGIGKYTYTLSESEKQELNIENGGFKLLRTVFGKAGSLKVFTDGRMGSASGNDLTEAGLRKLAGAAKTAAESASEDPCHDIAPDQGKEVFRQGEYKPDLDRFIERIREFLETAAKEYPEVKIMSGIGSFDRWHRIMRNTNGTEFETFAGQYGFSIEICASDGEKTTGLDYTGVSMKDLDTPFMELGDLRRHLEDIRKSISPETLQGKFTGTVVMTPGCAGEFLSMLLSNYIGEGVVINGTSLWLDKVGEQVGSELLTVGLRPYDERIVSGERGTSDGYRSENVTLIDHGVLKTHLLNLYAAKKTGRPVVRNTGFDLVVENGNTPLADMIASVDRGLLLGGFSGGDPGTNGEFSGVAKNSFLIEKGKVKGAVTETMVNGNLGELVKNIRAVSRETCCDGSTVLPYLAADGVVISGK
jgi:PmbA protein